MGLAAGLLAETHIRRVVQGKRDLGGLRPVVPQILVEPREPLEERLAAPGPTLEPGSIGAALAAAAAAGTRAVLAVLAALVGCTEEEEVVVVRR